MTEFLDPKDWQKEVIDVRVKQQYHPTKDKNDDNIPDVKQEGAQAESGLVVDG